MVSSLLSSLSLSFNGLYVFFYTLFSCIFQVLTYCISIIAYLKYFQWDVFFAHRLFRLHCLISKIVIIFLSVPSITYWEQCVKINPTFTVYFLFLHVIFSFFVFWFNFYICIISAYTWLKNHYPAQEMYMWI